MITALCGTNSFQIKAHLDQLTRAFVAEHGELALEVIDASESESSRILGAIESLPFLAARKMVVVHDLSQNTEACESLEQLIERAGETTDLVIIESRLDKRGSYYKQLKKLTDFNEFNEMDEAQLAVWLMNEAKAQGATLHRADAVFLIQRAGQNQLKLSHELEKLVQYNPKITKDTIIALVDENPSSTIFNLVDSVFSGNLQQALQIYDDQRKQRVEPQAIHGMLVWQMHAVTIALSAPKEASAAQIAKQSGMSPYVVQKSQRIAKKMGRSQALLFMKLLRDIDYRGKHEVFDYDEAMRYAIVTLAT